MFYQKKFVTVHWKAALLSLRAERSSLKSHVLGLPPLFKPRNDTINVIMSCERLYKFLNFLFVFIVINSFFISGCVHGIFGPLYADGYLRRPVVVTVLNEDTSDYISGAEVKIIATEQKQQFIENLQKIRPESIKDLKYEQKTNKDGRAELLVFFGFGYRERFGIKEGGYDLKGAGAVQVNAEGYEPFESDLATLSGEDGRSVNDKSPIKVSIKLTPLNKFR
jgi:hypothetical protein